MLHSLLMTCKPSKLGNKTAIMISHLADSQAWQRLFHTFLPIKPLNHWKHSRFQQISLLPPDPWPNCSIILHKVFYYSFKFEVIKNDSKQCYKMYSTLFLAKTLSKAMAHSLLSSCIHLTPIACMRLDYVLEGREEGWEGVGHKIPPSEILKYFWVSVSLPVS